MHKREVLKYEVLQKKIGGKLSYAQLLETEEWIDKRKTILIRDGFHCRNCGSGETESYFIYGAYCYIGEVRFERYAKIDEEESIQWSEVRIVSQKKPYHLQVHHTYYIIDRLPWQYEDKSLVTLCNWCHYSIHEKETIPVYENVNGEKLEVSMCTRCHGTGYLPAYSHVENGICFRCNGDRFTYLTSDYRHWRF